MNIELLNAQSKNIYLFEGDEIQYTIDIKNEYNYTVSNIEINYLLFDSLTIVKQNITGNTQVIGNFLNGDSLKIPKLSPNSYVKINVKVKISKQLKFNSLDIFQVKYLDKNKDLQLKILKTHINLLKDNLSIDFVKSTPSPIVGENLNLKIIIKNENPYCIKNLNIAGYLDSKTKIIDDSLTINDVKSKDFSLNYNLLEIDIPFINSYETKILSFNLENLEHGNIENKFLINYYFDVEGFKFNKSKNLNLSFSCYKELELIVKKIPSKNFATIEDKLDYKIEIKNTKNKPLYNVNLSNFIPKNCKLIKDSFKINNRKLAFKEGSTELGIGNINENEYIEITYSLKILKCNRKRKLENTLDISYKFVNEKNAPIYKTLNYKDNSENDVFIGISTFKYLNINKFLNISFNKPKIEKIHEITSTVTIKEHYVANTRISKSNENQNLTGAQLILFGVINLTLKYSSNISKSKLFFEFFEIPFSTFIVLPDNYNEKNKIDLSSSLENNGFSLINNNTISFNADILLNADVY